MQERELDRSEHSLNSSKTGKEDNPNEKEYRKLGQIDKYCEEFMYFLDDAPVTPDPGEISPTLATLIDQMNTEEGCFRPRE